jgi:transcriptional regulator with XRE-family HTH domain
MAKRERPVLVGAFGKRLAELRGNRSRQQIVNRAAALGVKIDPTALFHYERGSIAAPDPSALWALARIYGVALEELVSLLVANRNDPDVAPESVRPSSAPSIVVEGESERQFLERLLGLSPAMREELEEFLAIRALRELPRDERAALLATIHQSARLSAPRGGAAESAPRIDAETPRSAHRSPRRRRGA